MDFATGFSTCEVVLKTALSKLISDFEPSWVDQLWPQSGVLGDSASNLPTLPNYMTLIDTEFRSIFSQWHNMNVLESKQGVARSIYLRMRSTTKICQKLYAFQVARICNNLYKPMFS